MRLVKIDGVYINVDMVDAVSFGSTKGITHVFVGGSENPFIFNRDIDEVVAIIEQEIEKPVLDKIRAEIVKKHLSVMEKNDFESGRTYGYEEILEIIGKYKAESEGKNENKYIQS